MNRKWLFLTAAACLVACSGTNTNPPPDVPEPLPEAPVVHRLTPAVVIPMAADLNVTVEGDRFSTDSTAQIGDTVLTAAFVNSRNGTAIIPASLLAEPTVHNVVVTTPGAVPSDPALLTIVPVGTLAATTHDQVARLTVNVPRAAEVLVEFGRNESYGLRTWVQTTPETGGTVEVLIAGMLPDSLYHIRRVIRFPDGVEHVGEDMIFETPILDPAVIPSLRVTHYAGQAPRNGVQALMLRGTTRLTGLVTDLDGGILWYIPDTIRGTFRITPRGTVLYRSLGLQAIVEADLTGAVIRSITPEELNAALFDAGFEQVAGKGIHHDWIVLPNGQTVLLTSFERTFDDLTGFEGQDVILEGDGLVALDEDWNPAWVWSSFDHFDPNRWPWGTYVPGVASHVWTHGNAVEYAPTDGSLLLSLRHQHWVTKIDYADGQGSGKVLWNLGWQGDFSLQNGGVADWQYSQHVPSLVSYESGIMTVGVWDNGFNRVIDDQGTLCTVDCFSRAMIFEVNENDMTAKIVWEDVMTWLSRSQGSIDAVAGGNVIWASSEAAGGTVREMTLSDTPAPVWQLEVEDDQRIYRSVRIPSLYPGVEW